MTSISPTHVGGSPKFMHRMSIFSEALSGMFAEVDKMKLSRAAHGLKSLEFREQGGTEVVKFDRVNDSIVIYPMLCDKSTRIDFLFYRALGRRLWKVISPDDKLRWIRCEVIPPKPVIDRVAAWFRQNQTTAGSKATTGMETTVLKTLEVVFGACDLDPKVMDLKAYPPAQDLVSGNSRICLKPVIAQYGGESIEQFENAFAEYCINSGRIRLTDSSIEEAVNALFKEIALE